MDWTLILDLFILITYFYIGCVEKKSLKIYYFVVLFLFGINILVEYSNKKNKNLDKALIEVQEILIKKQSDKIFWLEHIKEMDKRK